MTDSHLRATYNRLRDSYEPGLAPRSTPPDEVSTCYLAGPMRGIQLHNFPAFFDAAIRLRRAGWAVLNPAEFDMAAGVNPDSSEGDWPISVQEMLRTDFQLIIDRANAIVLLPGWSQSVGAKMELAIAYHVGLPMFELRGAELVRLFFDGPPSVEFESAQILDGNRHETIEHISTLDGVRKTTQVKL